MVNLSGQKIRMTRGDSVGVTLNITKDGAAYVPQFGDKIRFAMSYKYESEPGYVLVLEKDIPLDTLNFTITPEDTKNLPYGSYNYDVQITQYDGWTDTFISSQIIITEEVL